MLFIPVDVFHFKSALLELFPEIGHLLLCCKVGLALNPILQEDVQQRTGIPLIFDPLDKVVIKSDLFKKEAQFLVGQLLPGLLNHHLALGDRPVHQIVIHLIFILDVGLILPLRHFEKRWLGDVKMTPFDHLGHMTIEKESAEASGYGTRLHPRQS